MPYVWRCQISYNGSGTFNINTSGQPVVTGTVISSTAFNALTADLATGLSTAITKDGQTIVTANIPFNTFKLTGIGVATATGDALTYGQAATVTTLVASTSITNSGLTATRLTFAGVGGLLSDSANLTWDGSYLSAASIKNAALTSGRVPYAGTAGLLQDSANLTFNGTTLTANTIGAFTLGGTVAGGGNQLNNVIIGTTTPLAGAFTTLSASSTATLSGLTASTALALDASKNIVSVTNTGSGNNVLATSPTITGATLTTSAFNGTVGATTPSTGAFTTLSATGTITASNATALTVPNGYQTLYRTTNDTSSLLHLQFFRGTGAGAFAGIYTTGDASNGVASLNLNINGTDIAKASSTGLAVSGNVDLTAANTFPTTGMFLRAADNQLKICAGSAGIAFAAASGASTLATLDSSGNLGLGVTPSAWRTTTKGFQIGSQGYISGNTANQAVNIGVNKYINSSNQEIYITSDYASYYQQYQGSHTWLTAPSGTAGNAITFTQAMTLDASGNLMVGVTTPTNLITAGPVAGKGGLFGSASSAGSPGVQGAHTSNSATGYVAYFANSGSSTGLYISNTAAWQSTSDERLKEDVKDIDSTERILNLRPVDYLWKTQATSDNPTKRNFGFIAQEVQQVFPDLVGVSPDGMLSVEYTGLIAPLVKAIQEQQAIITALTTRITALEAK